MWREDWTLDSIEVDGLRYCILDIRLNIVTINKQYTWCEEEFVC